MKSDYELYLEKCCKANNASKEKMEQNAIVREVKKQYESKDNDTPTKLVGWKEVCNEQCRV